MDSDILHLKLIDLDAEFMRTPHAHVINDLPNSTLEDQTNFENLLITTYGNLDEISNLPSCVCGGTSSGFNIGQICDTCGTPVVRPAEHSVEAQLWIRAPIESSGFILPHVWVQLTKLLSPGRYNLMDWLTNPRSRVPKRLSKTTETRILYLESIGWVRGLNYFIDNFDKFIDLLPELNINESVSDLQLHLRNNINILFPRMLPVPNRMLLVVENTYVGSFTDQNISLVVNAARTGLTLSDHGLSIAAIETKLATILSNVGTFYTKYIKESMCSKGGAFRTQLASSRSHFCARGVITGITDPHDYRELHIPWAQGLELFKVHLINKLLALNYTEISAFSLVESSGNEYNPLLDKLLQEILQTGGELGYPCIFQRNPSLERGSAQYLYITIIKTNIYDQTFSLSPLTCKAFNADYDGDS